MTSIGDIVGMHWMDAEDRMRKSWDFDTGNGTTNLGPDRWNDKIFRDVTGMVIACG